jgi:hypothetical protein
MAEITTTQSFADGDTVTAAKLNNIIANSSVGAEIITNRSELTSVDVSNDFVLGYDASATGLRKIKPTNIVADSSITTAKLNDSSVTTAKINDSAVTTAKVADSAITTAKINDAGVTTAKINDSAVTTAKVNNGAITSTKVDTTGVAVLGTAQSFTTAHGFAVTTLTDGASIAWDLAANQVARVTLGGNRTLSNPTNKVEGNVYVLVVKQDGTGGRTLSFSSDYKFAGGTAPTITTTASKADVLTFVCEGTNLLGVASQSFL